MAKEETDIAHAIIAEGYKRDCFLSKNVRGLFTRWKKGDRGQPIKAGWGANGASDLIGFTAVTVTPEMVGQRIAVFTACEVKTETGRIRPEQAAFINLVKKNGGFAGVLRDKKDLNSVLNRIANRGIFEE